MELDSVFVLHRRPYRESSQLVDLFSIQQGRFSAIHRTSRKSPTLQPFVSYSMQFSGKGDLKFTKAIEVHSAPFTLHGRKLYCGFYLNELMVRLTWKGEASLELFELYRDTLRNLAESAHEEPVLRRFEFHLLDLLGYRYDWLQDSLGNAISSTSYYRFDPSSGFVLVGDNPQPSLLSGIDLIAISRNDWQNQSTWNVAKFVARCALQPLLGDKPLTSRALFLQ